MNPMNGRKSTLSKAVLAGRIRAIVHKMDGRRDAYKCANKTRKDPETGKTPLVHFQEDMKVTQEELEELYRDLNENLAEEVSLNKEYNKDAFDTAISIARRKVLERFGNFPMVVGLLECFLMYFEVQLDFGANLLNLRTQVAVEDRAKMNNDSYNLDGNPKK